MLERSSPNLYRITNFSSFSFPSSLSFLPTLRKGSLTGEHTHHGDWFRLIWTPLWTLTNLRNFFENQFLHLSYTCHSPTMPVMKNVKCPQGAFVCEHVFSIIEGCGLRGFRKQEEGGHWEQDLRGILSCHGLCFLVHHGVNSLLRCQSTMVFPPPCLPCLCGLKSIESMNQSQASLSEVMF